MTITRDRWRINDGMNNTIASASMIAAGALGSSRWLLFGWIFFFLPTISSNADSYDTLRATWQSTLISEASSVSSVNSTALKYWTGSSPINTAPSATKFYLWSDLPLGSVSANMVSTCNRLEDMALAYAMSGSAYYQNTSLALTLSNALDWLYANVYKTSGGQYDNWYHWEISGPRALNNTVVFMYSALSSTQLATHCAAVDNYGPNSTNASPYFTWAALTGANTSDVVLVTAIRGVIGKSSAKISEAKTNLSKVFPNVTSGDGFYADGSFVFHGNIAYTGHYGIEQIDSIATVVNLLQGTTWAITDANLSNIYSWIINGFEPLIYNGAMMDMVQGRASSWSSSTEYDAGADAIAAIRKVALFAPTATASALTAFANSPRLASGQFHFHNMDRVVALRSGFGFGLSMSSSRIANFENLFSTSNLKGWFTGDGMTYLYLGASDTQFTGAFWPTVDYYHLPGTTVEQGYAPNPSTSDQSWVGGAKVGTSYGAAGMSLHPAASSSGSSTLYGKKSWFMLNNKIVCLGSGITCSSANQVDTTVEDRRLGTSPTGKFYSGGTAYSPTIGWSSALGTTTWCSLDGVGGYYFPGGASNLQAGFVSSSGKWTALRPTDSDTATYTDNYLKLYFKHGAKPSSASYAYVILPGMTSSEVNAYAANPDISILSNTAPSASSSGIHAMKSSALGVVGANFWAKTTGADVGGSVDFIAVSKQSSVMTTESSGVLAVGVSDPTQTNTGTIVVTLNRQAVSTLSVDSGVTVTQLSPNIIFSVNANGSKGKTFQASFQLVPAPSISSNLNFACLKSTAVSYQITATNSPASFAASGLPAGLSLNSASGVISGTPTQSGTFSVSLSAVGSGGGTGTAVLTLNVLDAVSDLAYPFTAEGVASWTCPANVASVQVECWGGGGAGGAAWRNGQSSGVATAGGGAGGAYAKLSSYVVIPGNTYFINVGSGGVSSAVDLATAPGGDSWFSTSNSTTLVPAFAKGGGGGVSVLLQSTTSRFGSGGSAAGSSASVGDVINVGGNGVSSTVSAVGGGGGGSGGTSNVGLAPALTTDGIGALAVTGGGAGGNANAAAGSGPGFGPLSPPGGGGGGARSASTSGPYLGGSGSAGKVLLTASSLSNQAQLSSLGLSSGTLVPSFTSSGDRYTISVPYSTSTLSINPTALSPAARIKVNGSLVSSGSMSSPIAIAVGETTLSIESTAQDAVTSKVYVITVKRESAMEGWRLFYFQSTSVIGNSADSADGDGDGLSNLQEYVLGTNPTVREMQPLLSISMDSSRKLQLKFTANQVASALYTGFNRYYTIEYSTGISDLTGWIPLANCTNILGENQIVQVNPPSDGSRCFYRLKVHLE